MSGRLEPRVGLLGGTFDPPHLGHLIIAQDAALSLGLDRVRFVPAAVPPHKQRTPITPAPLRARMVELAIADDARFDMDTLELDRQGPSWTVDTLRELAAREPDTRWTLLIGADQYVDFETWREPDAIRRLATVAIMTRGGRHGGAADSIAVSRGEADQHLRTAAVAELPTGDVQLEVTRIDISATAVRRRVATGLPIRYLVPHAVEQFIFEQQLYLRNGHPAAG